MSNVLLLRTPTSPDAYVTHLHERGFTAFSLAVLETTLVHLSHLSDIQRAPPTCDGVILTSARAAEAWHAAARHVLDDADTELKAWTALPFYVVGSATARALRHSSNSNGDDHTDEEDEEDEALIPSDIRGAESGTGEALARFILSDLCKREARLLLLVGDKNADTIPNILHEGSVQVETLQVYETHGAHGFGEGLSRVIRTAGAAKPWWIVFFAPSSSKFAIPQLREHFNLPGTAVSEVIVKETTPRPKVHLAAVGPTTARFLEGEEHLRVDAVAPKPNAESLATTLRAFEDADTLQQQS